MARLVRWAGGYSIGQMPAQAQEGLPDSLFGPGLPARLIFLGIRHER